MYLFCIKLVTVSFFFCSYNSFSEEIKYYNLIKNLKNSGQIRADYHVGFDLDDTLIYSSPGFWKGFEKYGSRFLSNDKFWDEMNTTYDEWSLPKGTVVRMLCEHIKMKHKINSSQKNKIKVVEDELHKLIKFKVLNERVILCKMKRF